MKSESKHALNGLAGAFMGMAIGSLTTYFAVDHDVNKTWQDKLVSRGLAEWKLSVDREVTSSFHWLPKLEPTVRFIEVPLPCTKKHEPEKFYLDPGIAGTNYWYGGSTNYWVIGTNNLVVPFWTNNIIYN